MSFAEKLVRERRARLAAERLLDQKSRELLSVNDRLSTHARSLSDTVVEQRQDLERAQHESQTLKGRNHQVESDLERARTAARAIRAAEAAAGHGAHVAIVALTAHAMEGDSDSIFAAGIDHYLTKPLKKAAIAERIVASCPKDARKAVPAAEA